MPESNFNCNLPMPYPSVKESNLNRYDASMVRTLLNNKLSAINEYITQSVVLAGDHQNLADIIDCIAVTEAKHFKLLGRLLCLSGEGCDLRSLAGTGRRNQTSARTRPSDNIPLSFIERNIESEKMSASDIRLVLSQVNDRSTVEVLRRILADEEHHADIFTNLKRRYA